MATRVTFRRVFVTEGGSIDIPHVKEGWVQVFDADFRGTRSDGSGGFEPHYLLDIAVVEPIPEGDNGD